MFAAQLPKGLSYQTDYLSPEHEAYLRDWCDTQSWMTTLSRRVQQYGYRYEYKARRVKPSNKIGELPDAFGQLADMFVSQGIFVTRPDQVIVNEYLPGQGIAAHVDCVPCFGGVIASVSLLSSCVMRFERGREKREIQLRPRSLIVMKGEARTGWRHAIPHRKTDRIDGARLPRQRRISLTFRTMRFESS